MTDRSATLASPMIFAPDGRRTQAFNTARRHSRRVRRLRRAMIAGPILLVAGIIAVTLFDPFGKIVAGVAIDGASIDGTKVTMTNPHLSGFRKDGRPYAIEATRAVQDVKTPTLFELHDLKARFTMPDRSATRVTADVGNYNSTSETMVLSGGAHVIGDNGLDVVTTDAMVDFATNALTTTKPVTVAMPGKRIAADAMQIQGGGEHVSFDGHVHTDILPGAPDERPGSAPATP